MVITKSSTMFQKQEESWRVINVVVNLNLNIHFYLF